MKCKSGGWRRLIITSAAVTIAVCGMRIGAASANAPPCRYNVVNGGSGDGTVQDTITGLTWQQTITSGPSSWTAAQPYCSGLSYGGYSSGWRLPTLKELESIVDLSQSTSLVDPNHFPNTPAAVYWTATPYAPMSGQYWGVDFQDGGPVFNTTDSVCDVRCVR